MTWSLQHVGIVSLPLYENGLNLSIISQMAPKMNISLPRLQTHVTIWFEVIFCDIYNKKKL